jgi:hypothetical protein
MSRTIERILALAEQDGMTLEKLYTTVVAEIVDNQTAFDSGRALAIITKGLYVERLGISQKQFEDALKEKKRASDKDAFNRALVVNIRHTGDALQAGYLADCTWDGYNKNISKDLADVKLDDMLPKGMEHFK